MVFGVFKLKKRILIICPYPIDECAGQRFKYEKHLKYLEENGYEITIESFMNDAFWKIVYKKGFILQKIIYTLVGYLNRILIIFEDTGVNLNKDKEYNINTICKGFQKTKEYFNDS